MRLIVLTPEETLLDQDGLSRIKVRLADGGSIGIRPNHHPLIAETVAGVVFFGEEDYDQSLDLEAGILYINFNQVTLFTSGLRAHEGIIGQFKGQTDYPRLTQTMLSAWEGQREGEQVFDEE